MKTQCDRCGTIPLPKGNGSGKVSSCATSALRSRPNGRPWPMPRLARRRRRATRRRKRTAPGRRGPRREGKAVATAGGPLRRWEGPSPRRRPAGDCGRFNRLVWADGKIPLTRPTFVTPWPRPRRSRPPLPSGACPAARHRARQPTGRLPGMPRAKPAPHCLGPSGAKVPPAQPAETGTPHPPVQPGGVRRARRSGGRWRGVRPMPCPPVLSPPQGGASRGAAARRGRRRPWRCACSAGPAGRGSRSASLPLRFSCSTMPPTDHPSAARPLIARSWPMGFSAPGSSAEPR